MPADLHTNDEAIAPSVGRGAAIGAALGLSAGITGALLGYAWMTATGYTVPASALGEPARFTSSPWDGGAVTPFAPAWLPSQVVADVRAMLQADDLGSERST